MPVSRRQIGWVPLLAALATFTAARMTYADVTTAPASPTPAAQPAATGEPIYKLSLSPLFAPDSINQRLVDANARPAGMFKYGPVSLIDPFVDKANESLDKIGLHVGFSYTALLQAATNGPGTRTAAGGDADFFGDWRLLGGKDDPNKGYLYFAAENRHDLGTGIAPSALGGQIGSLWGTTNGFGEQPFTLKELYWEQRFAVDRVFLRIGKLDPENYYDSNYWQSDSKYFMNQAFSSFPVRSFPGQGLGINVTAKLNDLISISTGAQDAQGKKTRVGFDTLFEDFNLFSAGELRITPNIPGLGKGTYRFTGWYRDAGESNGKPHDAGFSMSFDQHVTEHLIPFFRYGFGEGNINGIDQMISTGVGWEGKLLTDSDVLAIAGSWGQPSTALRDQYATEVFYRVQVSPDNQATIGYQVIFNPAKSTTSDLVGILELRWRITF